MSIAGDVAYGGDFKESAKKRLKSTGTDIAKDALSKVETLLQAGNGYFDNEVAVPTKKRKTIRKRRTQLKSAKIQKSIKGKPRKKRSSKPKKAKKPSKKKIKKVVKKRSKKTIPSWLQ
jgi:hypothetical protein